MGQGAKSGTVDVGELQRWLARGERVELLDMRDAEDHEEWSIPGSRHWDVSELVREGRLADLPDPSVPEGVRVVAVCYRGRTSLPAAAELSRRGHPAVSLEGGMNAWSLAWNVAERAMGSASVIQLRRVGKGCLSYLLISDREAVVVDPSLDPEVYVQLATERGARIVSVVDTHVHADHLSRARLVAERSGATLCLPKTDRVSFAARMLGEGDEVRFGGARLVALDTPGHTPESMCYLLEGFAVFTGDTLFLDGVGRPDLEASPEGTRDRARLLHASLRRLMGLPAATVVLPAHTSAPPAFDGRMLGASMAEVAQRVALLKEGEESFVRFILGRIPPTPPNHHEIVALNEAGQIPDDVIGLEAGANRCAIG